MLMQRYCLAHMEGVLALYDVVYQDVFPFLVVQSTFTRVSRECTQFLSVAILMACLACGCSVSVFLSKVLYSLFGPYRSDMIGENTTG